MEEYKDLLDGTNAVPRRQSISEQTRTLGAVCGLSHSRNLMIWIILMATCFAAVTISTPLLGAAWFAGCIADDGRTIIDDPGVCDPDYRSYNLYSTIFWSISGGISFLLNGFFGRLSDSFGRKIFIGLCLVSYIIPTVQMVFYVHFILYLALSMFSNLPKICYEASIADMFPDSKSLKTVAYGVLGAMAGAGIVPGSMIALLVSFFYGNYMVFVGVGAAFCLLIPYWWFLIGETLPKTGRKPFTIKNYNPFRPLFQIFHNKIIMVLSVITFIASWIDAAAGSLSLGFAGDQYNMKDGFETNLVFAAAAITLGLGVFVSGLLIMPIFKKYKVKNVTIMIFSNIIKSLAIIMFSSSITFYDYRYHLFIGAALSTGISTISSAAGNGIASHHLFKNEQGVGLGILQSYGAVGGIISPTVMGWIYFQFTNDKGWYLPALIWYICLVLNILNLLIIICPFRYVLKKMKDKKQAISPSYLPKPSESSNAPSVIEMPSEYYFQ